MITFTKWTYQRSHVEAGKAHEPHSLTPRVHRGKDLLEGEDSRDATLRLLIDAGSFGDAAGGVPDAPAALLANLDGIALLFCHVPLCLE